jgi:hypothetical protein
MPLRRTLANKISGITAAENAEVFVGSNTTYNIIEGELLAHKIQGMAVELTPSVASRRFSSAAGGSTVGL